MATFVVVVMAASTKAFFLVLSLTAQSAFGKLPGVLRQPCASRGSFS